MPYVLGTDEAGYGPNLGPLVVSATLWKIPETVQGDELYAAMPAVRVSPKEISDPERQIVVGDSKQLYKPRGSLAALESVVLGAARVVARQTLARPPATWREFLTICDPQAQGLLEQIRWYKDYETDLPIDATDDDVSASSNRLEMILSEADIQLLDIRLTIVFPEPFNDRANSCGKSSALSLWTFELIKQLLPATHDQHVLILCDKHGARNHYAALLQHTFPDFFIEVRHESKSQSIYRWGPASHRVEARFTAKGEQFLATALASMTAKYTRELTMRAFNIFWCSLVPDLTPTAGYPTDAKRFMHDISDAIAADEIPMTQLWRDR